MSVTGTEAEGLFRHRFVVPEEVIDRNGHVNNVVYIQWMQDVAVRHSAATGGTAAMRAVDCTWVVRSHKVEYLRPAFAADVIEAVSWVVNVRRVRSLRRYRFERVSDGTLIARGETDWVFVSVGTGRPCAVPETVSACFPLLPEYG